MSHLPVDPLFDDSTQYIAPDWSKIGKTFSKYAAITIIAVLVVFSIVTTILVAGQIYDAKIRGKVHVPKVKIEIGDKTYETPEN